MIGAIVAAALTFLSKLLDFLNPWGNFWLDRKKKVAQQKDDAQRRINEAAKRGDHDAFLDARSDKHSASE